MENTQTDYNTSASLQTFSNPAFGNIRTATTKSGEPLFTATDICRALELGNTAQAIGRLDDDEKGVISNDTLGGKQEMAAVTESGLYSLVLGSRKPEAKEFRRWITHEVIPSIRKHGAYATPATIENIISNPEFGIQLLTSLKAEQEKNKTLAAKNTEMAPKALFADAVSSSHTSILIGDLAKILKGNGISIGQKRLFEDLRSDGYLIKSGSSKNMPTQRSMELGLMEIKEGSYINGDGQNITTRTTKVTGKGQIYFVNRYLNRQNDGDQDADSVLE